MLTKHDIALANLDHAADMFPLGSCVRTRDLPQHAQRIYGRVVAWTLSNNVAYVNIITAIGHHQFAFLSIDLTHVQPSEMPK